MPIFNPASVQAARILASSGMRTPGLGQDSYETALARARGDLVNRFQTRAKVLGVGSCLLGGAAAALGAYLGARRGPGTAAIAAGVSGSSITIAAEFASGMYLNSWIRSENDRIAAELDTLYGRGATQPAQYPEA